MFWLECGDQRSGQFVFYDLKVSKDPCNIPIPEKYSSGTPTDVRESRAVKDSNNTAAAGEEKKEKLSEEEKQQRREKAAKAVGVGLGILQSLMK